MDRNSEYQLLKIKVASDIVRSSQAAVAFSRAFYLEEILIGKIEREMKEFVVEKNDVQADLLTFVDEVERTEGSNSTSCIRCHRILDALQIKHNIVEEFRERIIQAKARRQAKSCLLEKLSSHDLMKKFEIMTLEELKGVQVPEFSCFINDSDFGFLEALHDDWSERRKGLLKDFHDYVVEIQTLKMEAFELSSTASSYDTIMRKVKTQMVGSTGRPKGRGLVRRFSTLLRRKSSVMSESNDSSAS